jgi:hypothetical protein
MSSSSSSSERNNSSGGSGSSGMTIDIRPMIEDVSQVMTKHITNILSGVIGEYTIYKETHDTIMGLPCVRKLQERISELEQDGSGGGVASAASAASRSGSREEEVAQLQSAIEDLNRYIHALESKVNMKQPVSSDDGGNNQPNHHQDEESVRLEIHETDEGDNEGDGDDDQCESTVETSSTHKNVIITTEALEDTEANAEAEAEEDTEANAEEEAEVEDTEANAEAEAEAEEDAEAEEAEAEDTEENAEAEEDTEANAEAEVEDTEANAEAEEDTEANAEAEVEDTEANAEAEAEEAEANAEAEAEEAEAEEETEEVEEVKIKGKTYFTTNPQNGIIYACVDDDVGDEVGVFKNGVAVFNKGKK